MDGLNHLVTPGTAQKVKTMYFLFGRVAGRWGWIPAFALKRGVATAAIPPPFAAEATLDACNGRVDGIYCNELLPYAAYVCSGGHKVGDKTCAISGQSCVGPNGPGSDIVCQ